MLLFFCGLRRGEVLGLRIKDIDIENGTISINQNITPTGIDTPKTETSRRTVSCPNKVIREIKKYIETKIYKPEPNQTLFRIGPDRVSRYFREIQNKMGMEPRIRLHDLRHSHASLLINLGFSPDIVADRLGHANASMVLRVYGHMYPQKRIEVIDKMNELLEV